ncbi:MAG: hypothetical protein R2699_17930 [Acidimicrobiales bacterium]
MSVPRAVLDSGVVDLAETDQEFRWVVRDLVEGGWEAVIPTVVLAEAVTGRPTDAPVNRVVKRLGTKDTDQAMARRAGQLRSGAERAKSRRVPSGIDAIVAATQPTPAPVWCSRLIPSICDGSSPTSRRSPWSVPDGRVRAAENDSEIESRGRTLSISQTTCGCAGRSDGLLPCGNS